MLRTANVALTAVVSLLVVTNALVSPDFPLVSFTLMAVITSITLFFWPNPRGFALGLYVGGLVSPLVFYTLVHKGFALDFLPYFTFMAVMAVPLFPKVLSWKYLQVRRLNLLAALVYVLAVLLSYYFSGGSLQPYFIYVFALGLGIAVSVMISEAHSITVVGRVALPLLASQVYLSGLVYLMTHPNFVFNPLLLLDGLLQDSWLYFSSSILLLVSSLLMNADKGLRYLPEAMIAANLGSIAAFAVLIYSPVYAIVVSLSALAGSTNEVDMNLLRATAIYSFFFQKESVQRDVALLYSKAHDVSDLACTLLNLDLCDKAVWLSDEFGADLLKCNRDKLVSCLMGYPYVPKGVARYITGIANERPVDAYNLAVKYSGDPEVVKLIDKLKESATERLKAEWDPRAWVGNTIHGYRVVSYVGRGGAMYVLKAIKDGKLYALKIPVLSDALAREAYQDFLDEYKALNSLEREVKGVVKTVEFRPNESAVEKAMNGDFSEYLTSPPVLVVEFMGGGTAEDLTMRDELFYSDEWEAIVREVVYRTAANLEELHGRYWIHLDVKPSNIMFDGSPGRTPSEVLRSLREGKVQVKLSDMASARKFWDVPHHFTPEFSPPDQVRAVIVQSNAIPTFDVFSLGMTAIFMLTRQVPLKPLAKYYDMALVELKANGSKEKALAHLEEAEREYYGIYKSLRLNLDDKRLEELIMKMVHPDPKMRPSTHEILQELEGIRTEGRKRNRQAL